MAIFWICDGTSSCTVLPALARLPRCSSRILAQDVAQSFAAAMVANLRRVKRQ